jgi:hypothetical protein
MTMGDRLDTVTGFVTIPHFDTEYDKATGADGARAAAAAKRADDSIFIFRYGCLNSEQRKRTNEQIVYPVATLSLCLSSRLSQKQNLQKEKKDESTRPQKRSSLSSFRLVVGSRAELKG